MKPKRQEKVFPFHNRFELIKKIGKCKTRFGNKLTCHFVFAFALLRPNGGSKEGQEEEDGEDVIGTCMYRRPQASSEGTTSSCRRSFTREDRLGLLSELEGPSRQEGDDEVMT